jgi:hypothetical protein
MQGISYLILQVAKIKTEHGVHLMLKLLGTPADKIIILPTKFGSVFTDEQIELITKIFLLNFLIGATQNRETRK